MDEPKKVIGRSTHSRRKRRKYGEITRRPIEALDSDLLR